MFACFKNWLGHRKVAEIRSKEPLQRLYMDQHGELWLMTKGRSKGYYLYDNGYLPAIETKLAPFALDFKYIGKLN